MNKIIVMMLLIVGSIVSGEELAVRDVASIGSAGRHLASQSGNTYVPGNMVDGNLNTAWALPYKSGKKSGEVMLQFFFEKEADVLNKITIHNGYAKSEQRYKENSRAQKIGIYINGIKKEYLFGTVTLDDSMQPQEIDLGNIKGVRVVYIRVLSVYPGKKWSDLCISEVSFSGIPGKEDENQVEDVETQVAKESGYRVSVPARKLALNEKQVESMSRSRYFVLTAEQRQSLSPVWDVDTLGVLPTNWYDCSCGTFQVKWTDMDSVYIPETYMPSQASIDAQNVDYGPWHKTLARKGDGPKTIARTFMGLDGRLYQMGKPVSIEKLVEQQGNMGDNTKYKPDSECTSKALSIDFPPTNIMDARITEMHKENLIKQGLKLCEMNTPVQDIASFGEGH